MPDLLVRITCGCSATSEAKVLDVRAARPRAEIVGMLLGRRVGADHPFRFPMTVTGLAFERVIFVTLAPGQRR